MGTNLEKRLKSFNPISLDDLISKASFLDRIEKKYILSEKNFEKLLSDLEKDFFILDIEEKTIFEYESIYMDTIDYFFYHQHQKKKNKRTKVRTRKYVDSWITFFEYKQKENWVIKKLRYQFDKDKKDEIDNEANDFFKTNFKNFYKLDPKDIFPSLSTKYNRITLCSKDFKERLTIDFNLRLQDLRNPLKWEISLENLVIIESKSISIDNISSKIMKKHNIKRSGSCSKYSLWLCYNSTVEETSTFERTMKDIEKIKMEK